MSPEIAAAQALATTLRLKVYWSDDREIGLKLARDADLTIEVDDDPFAESPPPDAPWKVKIEFVTASLPTVASELSECLATAMENVAMLLRGQLSAPSPEASAPPDVPQEALS